MPLPPGQEVGTGVIFAPVQQRESESCAEPAHDAHASDSGAAASDGGACSFRLKHVRRLVDVPSSSSTHVTSAPRGPLYTFMAKHVSFWPSRDAAHRTLHTPPLPPVGAPIAAPDAPDPPVPPAPPVDGGGEGVLHPPSASCAQPGQKMSASYPQA